VLGFVEILLAERTFGFPWFSSVLDLAPSLLKDFALELPRSSAVLVLAEKLPAEGTLDFSLFLSVLDFTLSLLVGRAFELPRISSELVLVTSLSVEGTSKVELCSDFLLAALFLFAISTYLNWEVSIIQRHAVNRENCNRLARKDIS